MKFKVGDKVRCITSISESAGGPKQGEEFFLLSVDNNPYMNTVGFKLDRLDDFYKETTKNGEYPNWGANCFELVESCDVFLNKVINEQSSTGTKNDSGKSRISLIPTDALVGMGNALGYGEKKYGTHNYRNGLAFSRLVDACLRHLSSWNEGENNDPESGLSHLDHALASLAMLKFMDVNRPDQDDRYIAHIDPKKDPNEDLYEQAKEIQKRGR